MGYTCVAFYCNFVNNIRYILIIAQKKLWTLASLAMRVRENTIGLQGTIERLYDIGCIYTHWLLNCCREWTLNSSLLTTFGSH